MHILYIPFSFDDAVFDLVGKASRWRENYLHKGKEVVVIYHNDNEPLQQEKIRLALQEGGCQIYILSHGIYSSELIVGNQVEVDDSYKELGSTRLCVERPKLVQSSRA